MGRCIGIYYRLPEEYEIQKAMRLLVSGATCWRGDMAVAPEFTHALLDIPTESYPANLKRYLEAVGECTQIIQMDDYLGTLSNTQLSPENVVAMLNAAYEFGAY
ncbi:MAG: hypothetical protein GY859_37075 [Desulfobacterales bacterium]|nr:hypothetical protein [Desulfobacterales bacterium]